MPELPEVETIKRGLCPLIGRTIQKVKIFSPKQFVGRPKEVVGARVVQLKRRGKMLAIVLNNGKNLLIHLKLTGQLVFAPKFGKSGQVVFGHPIPFAGGKTLPGRSTRMVIYFKNDGVLFFNDVRRFGWVRVVGKLKKVAEWQNLGVEPLSSKFTPKYLAKIVARSRRPIKLLLMDQKKIAGVGNIYANEALFVAGILPARAANSLTPKEIKRLTLALKKVLREGIKYGGSSAKDEAYIRPDGTPGKFQQHFAVYQREGEKCPRCGGKILRTNLGGRGTFWCPKCQK